MDNIKYRGNKIRLGTTDYFVPALSLGQAMGFDDKIVEIQSAISLEEVTFTLVAQWIPIFLAAIRRNYEEVDEAFLLGNVDLNNFMEIREAVLGHRKETATLGE